MKLHGIHQLLVYADNFSVLVGSIPTMKKKTEPLVVASRETGPEVNAEKAKYMVTFQDQNTGQNYNTGNTTSERVESSDILEQP